MCVQNVVIMSGTISRSTSLQSPDAEAGMAAQGGRGDHQVTLRTNIFINFDIYIKVARSPGPSPLQHFVQAKKKINEIFREVETYVGDTEQFLVSIPADTGVARQEVQEAAKEFGELPLRLI